MKQCPLCRQTYTDDNLNFCLNDGELLSVFGSEATGGRFADDSPPTIVLDPARRTNPAHWSASGQPPAQWHQPQYMQNAPFGSPGFSRSRDQTLPTVALILGIFSLPMVCCMGGLWLGLPAAVVGFLGMRNADSDPNRYAGRGMAVAGMVLGIITFFASLIWLIVQLVS